MLHTLQVNSDSFVEFLLNGNFIVKARFAKGNLNQW